MAWNLWRGTSPRPANDVFARPSPAAPMKREPAQPRRSPGRGHGARGRIGAGA